MMIQPGTYKLSRDVPNPLRNRRNKNDWRYLDVFEEGNIYHVATSGQPDDLLTRIIPNNGRGGCIFEHDKAFPMLALYLERVEDKPSYFLTRTNDEHMALCVLDQLHADGFISIKTVEQCITKLREEVE